MSCIVLLSESLEGSDSEVEPGASTTVDELTCRLVLAGRAAVDVVVSGSRRAASSIPVNLRTRCSGRNHGDGGKHDRCLIVLNKCRQPLLQAAGAGDDRVIEVLGNDLTQPFGGEHTGLLDNRALGDNEGVVGAVAIPSIDVRLPSGS